jgi:two-component system, NtrC family, sensor histidine kinase HydH
LIPERIEKELNLLRRVSSIILAGHPRVSLEGHEPSAVLDQLVVEIAGAMEADAATIFLRDDSTDTPPERPVFLIRASTGLDPHCVGRTRIRIGEGLAGSSIAERRIISVADGPADYRYVHKPESGEEKYRGFLAAPILKDSEALGILVLHFFERRSASADEIRLIAAVAEQIGFAIENARLYTELSVRAAEMGLLYDVTRAIGGILDVKSVLNEIVNQSIRIIPSRAAILRTYEPVEHRLVVVAVAGHVDPALLALRPSHVGQGLAGEVAMTARPTVVGDAKADERAIGYGDCASILAVPLMHQNQVVGTLELLDRRAADGLRLVPFTESDERLLSILAQSAAEAYSRAELYAEMESIALTYRRKNHELTILNHISREIQGSTSMDEILYVILTGITSGHGLGYNRAMAFLIDEQKQELIGTFGIGATFEEVHRVWSEAPERFHTLEDYFTSIDISTIARSPFNALVRTLKISLGGEPCLLARVVAEGRSFNVRNIPGLLGSDKTFAAAIRTNAFAMVPIWTRELILGVLVVDNCFNGRTIRDEELVLLQTIANQCGLALQGARLVGDLSDAMQKLEVTTGKLVEAERLAAVGEVAAGVAHDIRNPLTAIGGFTRRLSKRLPPGDLGHQYAEIIEHEVSRLEKLVGEVLELASNRPRDLQEFDIVHIISRWRETNLARIEKRGARLVIEPGSLKITGDVMVLSRALNNILQNALDAVEEDGVITIRGAQHDLEVTLEINDNGCGMTPEQKEKAFHAFYTTKTEGTGLGLALAKKGIVAHGGSIHLESEAGKGTSVFIRLPRTPF